MSPLVTISASGVAAGVAWAFQVPGLGEASKQPAVQAAVIAAGVGLLVFALTQWVLHCRERTTLLLGKLELLYTAISSLGNLSVKRAEFWSAPFTREAFLKVKGTKLTDQIGMLQAFHFPWLQTRVKNVLSGNGQVLALLAGSTKATNKDQLRAALDELDRSVAGTLGLICENRNRLTRSNWFHYVPIVRSFFK
jgi:hypothetical protein